MREVARAGAGPSGVPATVVGEGRLSFCLFRNPPVGRRPAFRTHGPPDCRRRRKERVPSVGIFPLQPVCGRVAGHLMPLRSSSVFLHRHRQGQSGIIATLTRELEHHGDQEQQPDQVRHCHQWVHRVWEFPDRINPHDSEWRCGKDPEAAMEEQAIPLEQVLPAAFPAGRLHRDLPEQSPWRPRQGCRFWLSSAGRSLACRTA